MESPTNYKTIKDFYPYYLSQHHSRVNRYLHFIGTGLVLITVVAALVTQKWMALWLLPVLGYGFAWFGHFFFEKNKPATFTYPLLSLICDFKMFFDMLRNKPLGGNPE